MPTFFSQLNYLNTKIKHITWTFISFISPLGIVVQAYVVVFRLNLWVHALNTVEFKDTHVANGGEREHCFLFDDGGGGGGGKSTVQPFPPPDATPIGHIV